MKVNNLLKTLIVGFVFVIGIELGVEIVKGESGLRFNHIYSQVLQSQKIDGLGGTAIELDVIHDNSTGDEIVCSTDAHRYTGVACYRTGRNWK